MTEAELDKVATDPSMTISLELVVRVDNRAITPAERRALHQMMVKAAKRMGAQLALAVQDPRTVKLACKRLSSATGQMNINLAEDADEE
ncbi:hypothetical protein [Methylobacterium sp. 285MFTsu5.1]|uniref:hypothetical protein n=1 Tax=Methylobacterium sp. 285MFTsu5.1 TaxID=1172187 RepID=UPI00037331C0|nr:hypothetical protein [Methylobacterium sp. 285MFTsu5.1]